jgi:hypothetical protein
MKIFEDLSSSKNMVFDVKKLLNVVLDLSLWRRDKKKRPGQNVWQILRICAVACWFSLADVSTRASTKCF